ncbi:MAG: hypothetical protein K0R18_2800 [Bacillales bacterium]|jgi:8-oxo-dGTP pyrophosphatase MutT (NUDIX family)|nr:hypothetical protein [Bacillales bacterium]
MEVWDVYDKDRRLTGRTHIRGEKMIFGDYHLVVDIWIRNSKGQYLISKRHLDKPFGLLWECTGGSALVGDSSLDAAIREVKEELGISLSPEKGKLVRTVIVSDYFRDSWLFDAEIDLSDLKLQAEEVIDAKWASYEEIKKMIENVKFVPTLKYFLKLFEKRK